MGKDDVSLKIAIASDHGGFGLKKEIIKYFEENKIAYHDLGTDSKESVDYPDYALKVAKEVREEKCDRGIICCGTGIGVSIAANKVPGIRAALCGDVFSARASREHNDANVLTLGERVLGVGLALEIVETWLKNEFQGERHARRIAKIEAIEKMDWNENF